jgi:hypothetical protein
MRVGTIVVGLAVAALSLGASAVQAQRVNVEIENLRAQLRPPVVDGEEVDEEEGGPEGQAWRRSFTRGERSKVRFHTGVEIPTDALGITTLEELAAVVVTLQLPSATCNLVASEVDMLEEVTEFVVDIRERDGMGVEDRLGDCGGGVLPLVFEGDTADVFLDGMQILTGTFEAKGKNATDDGEI